MQTLSLFKNFKERRYFYIVIIFIFLFNLYLEFYNYKQFRKNEIYHTNGTIINIYDKKSYQILKIQSKNFLFFTKYNQNKNIHLFQNIDLFITTKISFISYLKGFYANSFHYNFPTEKIAKTTTKNKIYNFIDTQHKNKDISSLYNALFLATPLTQNIRILSSKLGISHLIAISGFHLGVISFVLYFILHLLYNKIHLKFYPYRNKRFDIMIIVSFILFAYLYFIDIPASLLRAFIMFLFALFLLRNNIKIFSFETLFIVLVLIIAFFPKLLFSLSLWFSIFGVFYIFLFLKYFKNIHNLIQFFLFNFWIYFSINPIVHYFFATTSLEQLYSPILTILFTVFYPISIILHIFNLGGIFDIFLEHIINVQISSTEISTPLWFFIVYIIISLLAIIKKYAFVLLNLLLITYNIWLFLF
ncbi:MAG: competence protein [Arcobacter sp.]|nr:MAG: competence protein [Arcobacter sp.]